MTENEQVVVEEVEQATQEVAAPATEAGRAPRGRGPRRDSKGGPRRAPRERDAFKETVIAINRVSKTVKGGRHLRFTAIVVIGDNKGKIGFATGKANEVPDAIKKALERARRNLFTVPIIKGDTIPHDVLGNWGATQVFLKKAPDGTGIVAGSAVRSILELAGVKNIYTKLYGSRTPINTVRATINAIQQLRTREQIAALRGKTVSELVGR